jgi:hypothetical protein
MISVAQCAALAGLDSHDMVLGVTLSAKHQSLLSSYLFNLERGPMAVRDMIVADMRRFRELGALQRAADLLLVLRLFLTNYPDASRFQRRKGELRANGEAGGDGERVAAATAETTVFWLARDYERALLTLGQGREHNADNGRANESEDGDRRSLRDHNGGRAVAAKPCEWPVDQPSLR